MEKKSQRKILITKFTYLRKLYSALVLFQEGMISRNFQRVSSAPAECCTKSQNKLQHFQKSIDCSFLHTHPQYTHTQGLDIIPTGKSSLRSSEKKKIQQGYFSPWKKTKLNWTHEDYDAEQTVQAWGNDLITRGTKMSFLFYFYDLAFLVVNVLFR